MDCLSAWKSVVLACRGTMEVSQEEVLLCMMKTSMYSRRCIPSNMHTSQPNASSKYHYTQTAR